MQQPAPSSVDLEVPEERGQCAVLLLKGKKPRHKEGQISPSVAQSARRSQVPCAPDQPFSLAPSPGHISLRWVKLRSFDESVWVSLGVEKRNNAAGRAESPRCQIYLHLRGCNNHVLAKPVGFVWRTQQATASC